MPIGPPTPSIQEEQGFELLLNGQLLVPLPTSIKPPTLGADRDLTLDRAPLSPVFFALGDLIQKPGPLVLSGPVYLWQTYEEAVSGLALIDRACQQANQLNFAGRLWASLLPGLGWVKADVLSRMTDWQLTVTLMPAGVVTPSTLEVNL